MFSIRTKLILAYTTVFGVMLIGFALVVYRSSEDALTAKLDAHLEAQAERLQSEIEEQHDEGVFPVVSDLADIRTDGLTDFHFRILDSTGRALVKDSTLSSLSGSAASPTVREPVRAEEAVLGGKRFRVLAMPVGINGARLYVIQLAASTADLESSLDHLRLLFLFSIPFVLLLAALAAYVVTRTAFKPVSSMIETARRISADSLDSRLSLPKVNDEIRQLASTLNGMMDRISKAFKLQKQFLADASHEIRTPLTVICSELEFAYEHSTDEQARESIRTALAEIDRLARMTRGMLMLTRLDNSHLTLHRETVRLDELLVECIQLLKAVISQKHIDLHVHVDDAIEIVGDRDKLKSAIINLLENAIKYSNPCGAVRVSLRGNERSGDRVQIIIEDNGSGIGSSDLPHIFERFYRSASSRAESSGSGLGLAIVDQVVKLHGGRVKVHSEIGKGSTFTLELPLHSAG